MSLDETKPRTESPPESRPGRQADRMGLADTFYCRARRRRLQLHKCLDDYLDANAFNVRRSACWRCPQGRKNREDYATS